MGWREYRKYRGVARSIGSRGVAGSIESRRGSIGSNVGV